jgi:hypothetical protein
MGLYLKINVSITVNMISDDTDVGSPAQTYIVKIGCQPAEYIVLDRSSTPLSVLLITTLIKKKFLVYQEIQKGAVAKPFMTKGLLIYA